MKPPRKSSKTAPPPADSGTLPAPEELDGESLLEWDRICRELKAANKLEGASRALLVLYVTIWATNRAAARAVETAGAVMKYPNGQSGPSPDYRVLTQTSSQLRGLLKDLGLVAGRRAAAPEDADLEF